MTQTVINDTQLFFNLGPFKIKCTDDISPTENISNKAANNFLISKLEKYHFFPPNSILLYSNTKIQQGYLK